MEVFDDDEGYIGLRDDGKVGIEELENAMEEEKDGSCTSLSTAGDRKDT